MLVSEFQELFSGRLERHSKRREMVLHPFQICKKDLLSPLPSKKPVVLESLLYNSFSEFLDFKRLFKYLLRCSEQFSVYLTRL